MNGEELLRRLEEDEIYSAVPVLVISTDATEQRIEEMMAIGAKGYLTKPFVPEDLRGQLERVVGVGYG
jgi:two-component system chemotaxis response regulator CheY